jgi:molybdopterin synthase sulfur carrier subunit
MNTHHIRYFASIRELLGRDQEQVTTQAATIGQLRDELVARGEPYASALAKGRAVRAAVNQVMAQDDTALTADAEVAFFPPVTGG